MILTTTLGLFHVYNDLIMRITNLGDTPEDILNRLDVTVRHLDKFWEMIFAQAEYKRVYYPPKVVLFTRNVNTECGQGVTNFGPFYCSKDRAIYLDVKWFEKLRNEYGADPGDFSEMYILAHEMGHHIQNLKGTFSRLLSAPGESSLRVKGELEADAYAGLWAGYAANDPDFPWEITEDDIDNALSAAHAVGDDTIQIREKGVIEAEKFGHGTAHQRQVWFLTGFFGQDFNKCSTWKIGNLDSPPAL